MKPTYETTSPESLADALTSTNALRTELDRPWRAINTAKRLLWLPLARLTFALAGVAWGHQWRLYGVPILQKHRRSTWTIGARLQLRSTTRSNPLAPYHPVFISTRRAGARLIIGDSFSMTGGTIVAETSVTIGDHVMVGANCVITDTDFHPLDPQERRTAPLAGKTAPVVIEDNVFIGMQTMVLKGVTIGANTVIGAGSVVTRSLPANVIAAGNPARIIRELESR